MPSQVLTLAKSHRRAFSVPTDVRLVKTATGGARYGWPASDGCASCAVPGAHHDYVFVVTNDINACEFIYVLACQLLYVDLQVTWSGFVPL